MRSKTAAVVCLIGLVWHAGAAADAKQIQKQLQQRFPNQAIEDVRPGPVTGLYEFTLSGEIVYTDGQHLIQGDIYDLATLNNLTKLSLLNTIDDDETIVFAADGKARHTLTVFTDTTCGYCRKLHQEIDQLTEAGITVRYLLYPRAGLGSRAARQLESVWCSTNPQQALTAAKAGKKIPEKSCDNPLKSHTDLAHRFGLRGTPMIITDTGRVINGYRPAGQLIKELNGPG